MPDPLVFGPEPPDPLQELTAAVTAARDPLLSLLALLAELRAAVTAAFGPPHGLMQIIPPDPDALARLAARTPQPDPAAAARYMAGRPVRIVTSRPARLPLPARPVPPTLRLCRRPRTLIPPGPSNKPASISRRPTSR